MRQGYSDSSSDEDDDDHSSSSEEDERRASRGHYSDGSSGDEDSDEESLPIERKGNYSDGSSASDDGSYDDEDPPSPIERRGKYSGSSSEEEDDSRSYEEEDQRGSLEEKEDDGSYSSDRSYGDDDSGEDERRSPVGVKNKGHSSGSSDYDESSNGEVNQDESSNGGEDQDGTIFAPPAVEKKTDYSEDDSSDYEESSDGEADHDQAQELQHTESKNEGTTFDRSGSSDESSIDDDRYEDQPSSAVKESIDNEVEDQSESIPIVSRDNSDQDESSNDDIGLQEDDNRAEAPQREQEAHDESSSESVDQTIPIESRGGENVDSINHNEGSIGADGESGGKQDSNFDEEEEDLTGDEDPVELNQQKNRRSGEDSTSRSDEDESMNRDEEAEDRTSGIYDPGNLAGNRDYSVSNDESDEGSGGERGSYDGERSTFEDISSKDVETVEAHQKNPNSYYDDESFHNVDEKDLMHGDYKYTGDYGDDENDDDESSTEHQNRVTQVEANEEHSDDTTDDEESSAANGKYEAAHVDINEDYSENFSDGENLSIDEKRRTAEEFSDPSDNNYSDRDRDYSEPSLGTNRHEDGTRYDDDNESSTRERDREPSESESAASSIENDGRGTIEDGDEDTSDRSASDFHQHYKYTEFSSQFNDDPTSDLHDVEWNPLSNGYRSESPSYESANASENVYGFNFQESNFTEQHARVVIDDDHAVDAFGSKSSSSDDDVEAQDYQKRENDGARYTPRFFDFLNLFQLWSKTNSNSDEHFTERKEGPKGDSFWPGKSHYGYIGLVLILLMVIIILIVRGRDSSTTPSSIDNVGNSTTTPTVTNVTSNSPTRAPVETIPPTLVPDNVYISGDAKIQSSREPIEGTSSDLSEKLCVKYLAGSEQYEEACFSTIYNRNGLAIRCTIEYDSSSCGACSICFGTIQESNLPYVGYETDCGDPTNCTELTEDSIQDFLVGPAFSDQDIWPTVTSAPVVAPTDNSTLNETIAPTLAPNSTDDCFSSRDDLVLAVDQFIAGNSVNGGSYIGDWCISNVKDLSFLFALSRSPSAATFNGDLSGWDVSGATDFTSMFEGASGFNSDLSGWDVSSVTSTANMFNQATSFTGDVSLWNVSSVTDMTGMFSRASSFNADISTWDVSNVRKMDQMFFSASAYNIDLSAWDLDSLESFNEMFRGARFFSQDLCAWAEQLEGRLVNASTVFSLTQCPTTSEIDFSSSPPSPFCFRCGF
jgi:surface protein